MKKILKLAIIIFIIIFSFIFSSFNLYVFADDIENDEVIDVNSEITSIKKDVLKEPQINARAFVVIDRNSNMVLYGKNENQKRKMASTTKIMTATIIIENYNLKDIVTISKKAAGTGGSRLGLKSGDKISVLDLLYGLLLCSGNDAAVALSEYAAKDIPHFCELMNKKANELGLKSTHFESPHGLDSDGHFTTAYELATLTNYALKNKTFKNIVGTKNYTININGYPKNLNNTNELLGVLDGVYGVKTGFTNGANRCLVTACKRNNMDIICVVLGCDTKKFRTTDSIKLINFVNSNFEITNLQNIIDKDFEKWEKENKDKILINKSSSKTLNLNYEHLSCSSIPIKRDLINSIKVNIDHKNYFEAPLSKNTNIGTIEVFIGNKLYKKLNIYNENFIYKKTFLEYFKLLIKNFNNLSFI